MIKFLIDHIDPLGQGVFKKNEDIFFVPKTLPGEEGFLEIIKKTKGVHFCRVIKLTKESSLRIKSSCSHFNNCNGCNFLHTDYDQEIQFKLNSFRKLLNQLELENEKINILKSSKRLHYRNRVQLHYHQKTNSLGFKGYKSSKIESIPNCLIMNENVNQEYQNLKTSLPLKLKNQKPSGHVEIYEKDSSVNISWNKSYAEGGFSQVNSEVNLALQELVTKHIEAESTVLDLFGGDGNLTNKIQCKNKLSIDLYNETINDKSKFHLNLFDSEALSQFSSINKQDFDTFIIDPPRSGFKLLSDWSSKYKPNKIVYVSCHPATMIRDIKELLREYQVTSTSLIDLFPSTYHYEAMIVLVRR